jgi:hypothetical protein
MTAGRELAMITRLDTHKCHISGEHTIFVISIFFAALPWSVTISQFHDYNSFLLLSGIMADPYRPWTIRLVAILSCVRILGGEFDRQRGRFISFCPPPNGSAAPNGTAHAML